MTTGMNCILKWLPFYNRPQLRAGTPSSIWRVLLPLLSVCGIVSAAEVRLAWDPSPSMEVTGYKVYWGTQSRTYLQQLDTGLATTATVPGLSDATTYYFAVTAYAPGGLESDYSNEVEYRTPSPTTNQAPTISSFANRTLAEDTSTGPIAFTVGDVDNDPATLLVSAAASNPALVPAAGLVLGGSGPNRTLTVTPAAHQSGSATITVTVSDGQLSAARTFTLTVSPVNDPPTLGALANRTLAEDTSTGPIAFTVGDVDNDPATLLVSAAASNPALVPAAGLVLGGSGPNRTLTVTPAAHQSGSATITVTVSDGQLSAARTFTLTVSPVNDPPTLGALANRTLAEDTSTGPIAFTVGDVDNDPATLLVSAAASNPALVPAAGLVLGGSGPNRTLTVTPAAHQSGSATITVTVSDGQLSAARAFTLTVVPLIPPPWIATDLGAPQVQGSSTYVNGVFTLESAALDIGGFSDEGHFLYQALSGDGEITGRLSALVSNSPYAKAGLMIRETLGDTARMVFIHLTPVAVLRQHRASPGSSVTYLYDGPPYSPPGNWFRLTRVGDTFTAYRSSDGVNWARINSAITVGMGAEVYVGLAVTSGDPALLATATFDNLTVIP